MPSTIDIEPLKLAKFLQVTIAQRKRALNKFITDYGPESNTVAECTGEIASLEMAVNQLIKEQAASPLRKRT